MLLSVKQQVAQAQPCYRAATLCICRVILILYKTSGARIFHGECVNGPQDSIGIRGQIRLGTAAWLLPRGPVLISLKKFYLQDPWCPVARVKNH